MNITFIFYNIIFWDDNFHQPEEHTLLCSPKENLDFSLRPWGRLPEGRKILSKELILWKWFSDISN